MTSVIINYCSNEKIFIDPILIECSKFSEDIIVSYGSCLYDGRLEDLEHIKELKVKYPFIQFVEYKVDFSLDLKKQKGVVNRPIAYWHNLARYTAIKYLKNKEWVFVIDVDEIPEGDRVKEWLSKTNLNKRNCYKMANYWYFKDPTNQATTIEDSVLLIHSDYLTEFTIFGDLERDHLIPASACILKRQVMGLDDKPMWYHFSGVRTKEGLRHKLKSWGHSSEYKNVDHIIDHIYKDSEVHDVIHNYSYIKVPNKFNIIV
jgi:hypothetical protein